MALMRKRTCNLRHLMGLRHPSVDTLSWNIFCRTLIQPVPWKMRLEMLNKMVIEILNGGDILVNCKFKVNKNLNLNLYRKIPRYLIFSILTSCLKSPHHSGFRLPFNSAFRVSSSTERAVWEWLFPFPSHNSLWEVPPLALIESFDPRGSVGPRNVVCCPKSLLFEF